jgi:hypothetical protein
VVNRINPFHGGGYVTALVEEHRSGRKVQPASPIHALRSTVGELVRTPFLMIRDALTLPATLMRRGRASAAPTPAREER